MMRWSTRSTTWLAGGRWGDSPFLQVKGLYGQGLLVVPRWVVLTVAPAETGRFAPCQVGEWLRSVAPRSTPGSAPPRPPAPRPPRPPAPRPPRPPAPRPPRTARSAATSYRPLRGRPPFRLPVSRSSWTGFEWFVRCAVPRGYIAGGSSACACPVTPLWVVLFRWPGGPRPTRGAVGLLAAPRFMLALAPRRHGPSAPLVSQCPASCPLASSGPRPRPDELLVDLGSKWPLSRPLPTKIYRESAC